VELMQRWQVSPYCACCLSPTHSTLAQSWAWLHPDHPPLPTYPLSTLPCLQRGVTAEIGAYLLPLIHDKEQR